MFFSPFFCLSPCCPRIYFVCQPSIRHSWPVTLAIKRVEFQKVSLLKRPTEAHTKNPNTLASVRGETERERRYTIGFLCRWFNFLSPSAWYSGLVECLFNDKVIKGHCLYLSLWLAPCTQLSSFFNNRNSMSLASTIQCNMTSHSTAVPLFHRIGRCCYRRTQGI